MTQEDQERIEGIQEELRKQLQRLEKPASYLEGDDEYFRMYGNDAAFLMLAIDSLDAACKRNAVYATAYQNTGQPASLELHFDPDPEIVELKEQPWWGQAVVFAIVGSIIVIFLAGLRTTLSWIYEHIVAWMHH